MKYFVLASLLIVIVAYVRLNPSLQEEQSVLGLQAPAVDEVEKLVFDQSNFYQSVQAITGAPKNDKIKGGIVPHHTLAGQLIADLLSRIDSGRIKTIILLSPNHWNAGDSDIISSQSQWDTPVGVVRVNTTILDSLVSKNVVSIQTDIMKGEHGIVELLPYIKHYLPSTSLVPLVIKNGLTMQQIDHYSDVLAEIVDDPTVVIIGAFDFSHYQYPNISAQKDEETKSAILNHDYDSIQNFGNDHTDASSALALLMKVMESVDTGAPEIINNTNSANILGVYSAETTSYFEIIYTK